MSHVMLLGAWHVSPSPLSNRRSGSCAWSSSVSSGSSEAVRLGAPLHRQWALRLSPCRGLRGLVRYWEIKIAPCIHGVCPPSGSRAGVASQYHGPGPSAHPEHRGPTWSAQASPDPGPGNPGPAASPSGCDRLIRCRGSSDKGSLRALGRGSRAHQAMFVSESRSRPGPRATCVPVGPRRRSG